MASKGKSLDELQTVFRAAHEALRAYSIKLEVKYGSGNTLYASKGERTTLDKLRARQDKAGDKIMTWLRSNTRWNWYSGTSYVWLCTSLTEGQAMSETAPVLPADAASYGNPQREYTVGAA